MTTPARTAGRFPPLGIALLVGINLVWGLNWPVLRIGLDALPPFALRASMIPLAGILLLTVARFSGQSLFVKPEVRLMLAISALLNITGWHALSAFGVAHMESGRAAVVAFTMPLWAAVFGRVFLGEPFTRRHTVALGFGMVGIGALLGGDIDGLLADPLGPIFMLGAAMSWAAGTLVQKRVPWGTPVIALTGWQMLVAGLPLIAGAAAFESVTADAYSPVVLAVIAFFVLGPLSYCYTAWYKVVAMLPTMVASLSTLMIPVIAVVSGALVHDEPLGWSEGLALAMVCASIALVIVPARPRADAARSSA